MGACDIHTAYKLVGQSFMKLVEEHQSRNSNSLKTIEVPNNVLIGYHKEVVCNDRNNLMKY